MCVAAAVGIGRALGKSSRWAARLLALYGVALVAAGALVADPQNGFPSGTPHGPPVVTTWHGIGHFVSAGIGFAALVIACMLIARWFARSEHPRWAAYSALSGLLFLCGFVTIAASSGRGASVLIFWAAVIVAWAWLSSVSLYLYRHAAEVATAACR